jgi:molecular chaperone DnaJ
MGMATRDYYEILGVSRDASQDEVRKAYLKLAHQYHPDKTGGDKAAEEKLKEINEAYDTLKNKQKRQQYDAFGAAGPQGAGFGGFGGFGAGQAGGFEAPFDDFFDVLFGRGGRGRRRGSRPGADLEYHLNVELREAMTGTKKRIRFARREICPDCNGTGAAKGSQPITCPDCGGAGQVRRAQGFFSISQTCPRCGGQGRLVSSPCNRCEGQTRVKSERTLEVAIRAGIDTGHRIRIEGEGEPGEGHGPRGDLYILIEVQPDEVFERQGNDVICQVPISFPQAALGCKMTVPTVLDDEEIKVPAGTQSGAEIVLRGRGFPDIRGYHRGDQIVRIQVEVPTKLTREQRELIEKLQEVSGEHCYPIGQGFWEKIKQSLGG